MITEVAGLLVATLVVYLVLRLRPAAHPFPPGPPRKPVIGNIFEVSPTGAWTMLLEYKRKYGELVFFNGLGNSILVLNSMKSILDLLDKRAPNYTNRPSFTVVGELMNLGLSMPLLPYGDEWRAQRKLAHIALSPAAVKTYYGIQEHLVASLCMNLLNTPLQFCDHVRLYAGQIVLTITYGLKVESVDDPYISHAEATMKMIGESQLPGAFLCDLLPFLKYAPSWVPFQKKAKAGREMIWNMVTRPLENVKSQMKAGTALPSLAQKMLSSDSADMELLEHRTIWAAGSMYGAGAESTYATVLTFIMVMALYPEKQRLAQAEIDRVVGTERMPAMQDREHLPYINAVIKETMRWHPVLPLGLARASAKDDIYEGYLIPKSTFVIPNIWAIAFEENPKYNPHEFIPERFLDSSVPVIDPATWAFGFARRICPGKHLAENSIFITIATILATFDLAKPVDGELEVKFTDKLISYPLPFKCQITPRSAAKAKIVEMRAAQSAP